MSLSLECKKAKRTGFIPAFYAAVFWRRLCRLSIWQSVPKCISDSKTPDANSNGSKLANDGYA